ncbi:MAG: hypothetical protein KJ709_04510 [Nanoarchaeota archaeon]|nr:hypothetical protein [Nanoarchaeota archaeon]
MRPQTLSERRRIHLVPKEEYVDLYCQATSFRRESESPSGMYVLSPESFADSMEYAYLALIDHVNRTETGRMVDPHGAVMYMKGLDEVFYWDYGWKRWHDNSRCNDFRKRGPYPGELLLMLSRQDTFQVKENDYIRKETRYVHCHSVSLIRQHQLSRIVSEISSDTRAHIARMLEGGR